MENNRIKWKFYFFHAVAENIEACVDPTAEERLILEELDALFLNLSAVNLDELLVFILLEHCEETLCICISCGSTRHQVLESYFAKVVARFFYADQFHMREFLLTVFLKVFLLQFRLEEDIGRIRAI